MTSLSFISDYSDDVRGIRKLVSWVVHLELSRVCHYRYFLLALMNPMEKVILRVSLSG